MKDDNKHVAERLRVQPRRIITEQSDEEAPPKPPTEQKSRQHGEQKESFLSKLKQHEKKVPPSGGGEDSTPKAQPSDLADNIPVTTHRRGSRRRWHKHWRRLRLLIMAGSLLVCYSAILVYSGFLLGHGAGYREGRMSERERIEPLNSDSPLSKEISGRLDAALAAENPSDAVEMLFEIKKDAPTLCSIDYLIALKALQAGQFKLARRSARDSIEKLQRVADSRTLLSSLAFPNKAAILLAQAKAADPANPYPYLETVKRLRAIGDFEGAVKALHSVRLRLMPVEAVLVVDIIEQLMHLQNLPDNELPREPEKVAVGDSRWLSAYLAMRRGELTAAAEILRAVRRETSAPIFSYIMDDPAMRAFALKPELAEFFP